MSKTTQTSAALLLGRLFAEGTGDPLSDSQLLSRFRTTRDPEAFATLVARHGPRVMTLCRGLLGPGGEADDAFQAVFLIFFKRIGTVSADPSLQGWLRGVARRVCRQVRLSRERRRKRETIALKRRQTAERFDPERAEILEGVRREIDGLPERYRIPIILCDLQGMTRDEAAEQLGWPAGTVGGRLSRARTRLRERLERRGVGPLSAFAPELAASAESLRTAIETAARLADGGTASKAAVALAATVGTIGAWPMKAALAAAVAACFAAGLIAAGRDDPPKKADKTSLPAPSKPASKAVEKLDDPKLAGHFEGKAVGPDGKPVAGARIYIVPNNSQVERPGPLRAKTGPDGLFAFDAPDLTFLDLDGLPASRQGLLIAEADGYAPDSIVTWGRTGSSFRSHFDPVEGAELILKLVPDGVPIQGRLLGPDGGPLAGAVVRLQGVQTPSYSDFDAYIAKYKISANEVWMFDLRSVYVKPEAAKPAVTDSDGRFRFEGLGQDRLVSLEVSAPDIVEEYLQVMTRDIPDVVLSRDPDGFPGRANFGAKFEVRLRKGQIVKGKVVDRETHQPIPGMLVGPIGFENRLKGTLTDAEGRFTVTGIHPAISSLTLDAVPGPVMPYVFAQGVFQINPPDDLSKVDLRPTEHVIQSTRGLPYRLKLTDEAGNPPGEDVRIDIGYEVISPNTHYVAISYGGSPQGNRFFAKPLARGGGIYDGFMLPGPGAVTVKAVGPHPYRSAFVDPKAFFAPGKTDWTPQELITTYGTVNTLSYPGSWDDQHDYAAIVLVDPPVDAKGILELSATLVEDKPRLVTLVGPDGEPVVGVDTRGLTYHPWDAEPRLRASTFPLAKLHPKRTRPIKFTQEDRGWNAFLLAQGDAETPYTVHLQLWGTVVGRILDAEGKPLSPPDEQTKQGPFDVLSMKIAPKMDGGTLSDFDDYQEIKVDKEGRFRADRLVPGYAYHFEFYRHQKPAIDPVSIMTLRPGETRDLGDLRLR